MFAELVVSHLLPVQLHVPTAHGALNAPNQRVIVARAVLLLMSALGRIAVLTVHGVFNVNL